jgi:hypothetical protein
MTKRPLRLALAALMAPVLGATLALTMAPQPASAYPVHRYYRWHRVGYHGPWVHAGFYYASAPGWYPGVGWVGWGPPAYAVPSYAYGGPGYYPAYYPGYYPAPAYYGPGYYGGPSVSIGLGFYFGGHGWRGGGWHR